MYPCTIATLIMFFSLAWLSTSVHSAWVKMALAIARTSQVFPQPPYTMVDCTSYKDYDFDFLTSHQYYRQSPTVRKIISESI